MELILVLTWAISLLIITLYFIIIFRVRRPVLRSISDEDLPGVTVIIAVKNGSEYLRQNLPFIIEQDYPLFEIIIVDDHSDEEQKRILEKIVLDLSNVKLIHSDRSPGKKNALTLGIEKSIYPFILCTDADCRPISESWIHTMINSVNGHAVVLGYSPYNQTAGLLNRFIRFETVMTGMQYLSWALLEKPYMGVGRNMLYPKSIFQETLPYTHHQHIVYGDDDLLVQAVKNKMDVGVCLQRDSFVQSEAPATWSAWLKQKHRHLSAGHHYHFLSWLQPGLLGILLVLHWVLLIPAFICCFQFWMLTGFIAALVTRWGIYTAWTEQLGDRDTKFYYPIFELVYSIYLGAMGLVTLLNKKKGWN